MKRKSDFSCHFKRVPLKTGKSDSISSSFCLMNNLNSLNFDLMPLEIKHKIFSYLEINELYKLCKISNRFNSLIQSYVDSKWCFQTRLFHEPHSDCSRTRLDANQSMKLYQNIGWLYRRIWSRQSFADKMGFLSTTLRNHICFSRGAPCEDEVTTEDKLDSIECQDFSICHSMTNYGHFLRAFARNWTETELRRLLQTLIQHCFRTNFWQRLTRLLFKYPGTDIEEELMVRLFLRRIFLYSDTHLDPLEDAWNADYCQSQNSIDSPIFVNQLEIDQLDSTRRFNSVEKRDRQWNGENNSLSCCVCRETPEENVFSLSGEAVRLTIIWLQEILKSYHIGHQAKILFILYGPLHKNKLMWSAMCENTAADAGQVSACFGELGAVLRLLQSDSRTHTTLQTVPLLEEMTNLPDEWLAENIACLLYTSGYSIASQYVAHKSENGLAAEVAITLTSMCLVQVKLGTSFKNVLALVDKACVSVASKRDRRYLLDKLAVSFQDVIVDLYETDEIDNRLEDFSTLLKAQASFVRAIFKRMYEE